MAETLLEGRTFEVHTFVNGQTHRLTEADLHTVDDPTDENALKFAVEVALDLGEGALRTYRLEDKGENRFQLDPPATLG